MALLRFNKTSGRVIKANEMIKKLLIGSVMCVGFVSAITIDLNKIEVDNTCDDLVYWLQVDLEEGRIDSMVFNSYTWNINEIKRRNNE